MKLKKFLLLLVLITLIFSLTSCSQKPTALSEKVHSELSLSGENKQNLETIMKNSESVNTIVSLDEYFYDEHVYPPNSTAQHSTDLAFYAYRLYAGHYNSVKTGYATEWLRTKSSKKMFKSKKTLCLLIPILQDDKPIGVTTIYQNTNYSKNIKIDPSTTEYNISDTIVDTGYMQSLEYIADKEKLITSLEDNSITTLKDIKYVSGYADGAFADFIYLDTDKGELAIPYLYTEEETNIQHGQIMPLYDFLEVLAKIEEEYPNGYPAKNIVYYIVRIGHALIYIIPTVILLLIILFIRKKIIKAKQKNREYR